MQLTSIEYNAIMQAINNAKDCIAEGLFLEFFCEPFGQPPEGYNEETLLQALNSVEHKIVRDNLPL